MKDELAEQWSINLSNAVLDSELQVTVSLAQIETTLKAFESLVDDIMFFAKPPLARIDVENIPVYEGNVGMQRQIWRCNLSSPCLVHSNHSIFKTDKEVSKNYGKCR